jgi:hypothetical protein
LEGLRGGDDTLEELNTADGDELDEFVLTKEFVLYAEAKYLHLIEKMEKNRVDKGHDQLELDIVVE